MLYIAKHIAVMLLPMLMQMSFTHLISQEPADAVTDFLNGVSGGEKLVMEKHIDNGYVNFLVNAEGDKEMTERLRTALFENFSYEIEKIEEREGIAAARVLVRNSDFSKVMDAYEKNSYDYIMENLDSDKVKSKKNLNAKCMEIYTKEVEKAAAAAAQGEKKKAVAETVVFIPMVDDGNYGWNIGVDDTLMQAVLGNLKLPYENK